ncbi:hypothetical protein FACS1894178_8280 [Bacteroidia bacterium]|nr:hypothetical protein FACS1894178_8280 [Bacteroidia bacterium]
MTYQSLYEHLHQLINYNDVVPLDEKTNLYNFDFSSNAEHILPGQSDYTCPEHDFSIKMEQEFENKIHNPLQSLNLPDKQFSENQHFRYHIFHQPNKGKAKEVILLFHGFNEKNWDKYLPWAKRLNEQTGKAVLLFPIAFHMNRAPAEWSDRRIMYPVATERNADFPHIQCCTLFNVAISLRLHLRPQRFIYSGLQTFYDVVKLIDEIREDKHSIIAQDATFDIFAYSIGCLLAEILIMSNPKHYFERSRTFMFCGGPVFNRLSPVSKFILDSETNVALYSFIVEHLENYLQKDPLLAHYLGEQHPEGIFFRSMLNYSFYRKFREDTFAKIGKRIMAVGLEKDVVIPSYEIVNTLKGVKHDLPATVEVWDFPYPYKHEDPFPVQSKFPEDVNEQFEKLMEKAAKFFNEQNKLADFFYEGGFAEWFRKFIKF